MKIGNICSLAALMLFASGCNNGNENAGNDTEDPSTESDSAGDADADGDGDGDGDTDADTDGDDSSMEACESATADAALEPVYLVFAFDVSGSMGKGDYPWHDRTLKWDPIVAATTGFLNDPLSEGIIASMTFFPSHSGDKCEDASYDAPDVPFTALPSADFADALDRIGAAEWEGGTPTLHVMSGTLSFIGSAREETPGSYAIVLVTDGYPQGCDDNSIESVSAVAEEGLALGIPTYVIGVNNPPLEGAPDTVSNLTDIAEKGGTEAAFIIDTGDPTKTASDFQAIIDEIRGASLSCTVPIPEPPLNQVFDKEKVAVMITLNGDDVALSYAPKCGKEDSWHYDDPAAPSEILLCGSTCDAVQQDPDSLLSVEFACESLITIE